MNIQKIERELSLAWKKVNGFPGAVELMRPETLDPSFAAQTIIALLQATYTQHALSRDPSKLINDIESRAVQPWIVSRGGKPVACATLINQPDGSVELGRAVSVENGSGAGKVAMLEAAIHAGKNHLPLVAEVRLADEFLGIPSGAATQKICLEFLSLVPHAAFPPFCHGAPRRHEMFIFAAQQPSLHEHTGFIHRARQSFIRRGKTTPNRLRLIQEQPFRLGVVDGNGQVANEFAEISRSSGNGCTLVPVEVADGNLGTIHDLLDSGFLLVGSDRNLGPLGLPVVLLATLARGTLIAPTCAGHSLTNQDRHDVQRLAGQFTQLSRS